MSYDERPLMDAGRHFEQVDKQRNYEHLHQTGRSQPPINTSAIPYAPVDINKGGPLSKLFSAGIFVCLAYFAFHRAFVEYSQGKPATLMIVVSLIVGLAALFLVFGCAIMVIRFVARHPISLLPVAAIVIWMGYRSLHSGAYVLPSAPAPAPASAVQPKAHHHKH